jgi:hypothetical protein
MHAGYFNVVIVIVDKVFGHWNIVKHKNSKIFVFIFSFFVDVRINLHQLKKERSLCDGKKVQVEKYKIIFLFANNAKGTILQFK